MRVEAWLEGEWKRVMTSLTPVLREGLISDVLASVGRDVFVCCGCV